MPLWRDLHVAVLSAGGELDDASHAMLMGGESVAEFPEGVVLEVETN